MIRPARPHLSRELAVHGGMFGGALALTLIAWWPATHGWFLLDDYRWLLPSDRRFDVPRSFISTWGHGYAYRPLMRLSFLADLQVFAWDARGWHLHNLTLHAVNATLLFSLIRAATSLWLPAVATAALFAVSPAGHENVAWISGRTYVLGGCFFLLSANLLLRSVQAPDTHDARLGARLFWSGVAAFVAAMASYEPTMVLPLVAWATVRCFPSLIAAPPATVSRRLRDLFLVLVVFAVCRVILLRGHAGDVGGWSALWIVEPIRYYVTVYVLNGHIARTIVPIVVIAALVASAFLTRSASVPASARRLPLFLAIAAFLLFLPFINVAGVADRFFYLVQIPAIAAIVLLLWLIGRASRAGAVIATAAALVLTIAGATDCRQAAREWTAAGTIARSVADDLQRMYPTWPSGTDLVVDTLPRQIGRASIYVLYTKESMLQHQPRPVTIDARVYFGEELAASPALRAARGERPAKYFRFDARTYGLTELSAMEWEMVHASAAR
jgi:hypothetical protein